MKNFDNAPKPERTVIEVKNVGEAVGLLDLNKRGLEEKGLEDSKEYKDVVALLEELKKGTSSAALHPMHLAEVKNLMKDVSMLSTGREVKAEGARLGKVHDIIKHGLRQKMK